MKGDRKMKMIGMIFSVFMMIGCDFGEENVDFQEQEQSIRGCIQTGIFNCQCSLFVRQSVVWDWIEPNEDILCYGQSELASEDDSVYDPYCNSVKSFVNQHVYSWNISCSDYMTPVHCDCSRMRN